MLATNSNFLKTADPATYRVDFANGLPVCKLCIRVLISQIITSE